MKKVINGDILIKFISTHDQIANIFTKRLYFALLNFLKFKLMVEQPPISLKGDVSEVSALGHLSVIEIKPKTANTATYAQRVNEIESKTRVLLHVLKSMH